MKAKYIASKECSITLTIDQQKYVLEEVDIETKTRHQKIAFMELPTYYIEGRKIISGDLFGNLPINIPLDKLINIEIRERNKKTIIKSIYFNFIYRHGDVNKHLMVGRATFKAESIVKTKQNSFFQKKEYSSFKPNDWKIINDTSKKSNN